VGDPGRGLSGVTIARILHGKGHEVVVLERQGEIGGLCRSRSAQGFTFDRGGSHIIFSRDQGALAFMQGVLGENRSVRDRNTVVFYKGKEVPYPFENGLSALPKEDLYLCIHGFIQALIAHEKGVVPPPANFREWIDTTFGRGLPTATWFRTTRRSGNIPWRRCPPTGWKAGSPGRRWRM